jgi:hypothetical protein
MRVTKLFGTLLIPTAVVALACGGAQDQASRADEEVAAGGEGERYEAVVVPEGLTWEEAKQRAEADGGHLVTITSAEEDALVYALIADNPDLWTNVDVAVMSDGEESPIQVTLGPWIGLYQQSGSEEPTGGWTWVTGEPVSYTNWFVQADGSQPEPNNMGGVEHFGHFFGQGLDNRADAWNDMPNSPLDFAESGVEFVGEVAAPHGYVVEFE